MRRSGSILVGARSMREAVFWPIRPNNCISLIRGRATVFGKEPYFLGDRKPLHYANIDLLLCGDNVLFAVQLAGQEPVFCGRRGRAEPELSDDQQCQRAVYSV